MAKTLLCGADSPVEEAEMMITPSVAAHRKVALV